MSEIEMKDEVETEEFTDELSDEALDRESEERFFTWQSCRCSTPVADGN